MTYLVYISVFGLAAVVFLWARDMRIYYRTGLPGYRKAAIQGILWVALAIFAVWLTSVGYNWEVPGLGVVLLALYLQGKTQREKVFTGKEPAIIRALGQAEIRGNQTNNKKTK